MEKNQEKIRKYEKMVLKELIENDKFTGQFILECFKGELMTTTIKPIKKYKLWNS